MISFIRIDDRMIRGRTCTRWYCSILFSVRQFIVFGCQR